MPLDPNALPEDAATLKKIVVDLAGQLDRESAEKHKYAGLIRELLEARRARSSERLTKEQAALFEEAWRSREAEENAEGEAQPDTEAPNASETATAPEKKRGAAASGQACDARTDRTRSRGSGKTLRLLRQRPASDRRGIERTLRVHPGIA